MTLATRCPSCATIFRMTTQEATARGGTVRCGVCGTAFNALDALVNVDTLRAQAPVAAPDPVSTGPVSSLEEQTLISDSVSEPTALPDTPSSDVQQLLTEDEKEEVSPESVPSEPASEALPEPTPDVVDGEPDIETTESSTSFSPEFTPEPEFEPEAEVPSEAQSEGMTDTQIDPSTESVPATVEPEMQSEPVIESSFADTMTGPQQNEASPEVAASPTTSATDTLLLAPRSKDHEASDAPGRRGLLISLCVLAVLLLAAQLIYVWRNALAANWPAARPLLTKTCVLMGCRVELPMNLDALVIESSELQAVPQTTNSYTFNTLLRNRGQQALRYPALELTLTDALDQLVLRRVILPVQYLSPVQRSQIGKGIAPNSELPIRISFDVTGTAIVGYRVGIFYP